MDYLFVFRNELNQELFSVKYVFLGAVLVIY